MPRLVWCLPHFVVVFAALGIGVCCKRYWCLPQTVLVFAANGIGVRCKRYWCLLQTVLVFAANGIGVCRKRYWCSGRPGAGHQPPVLISRNILTLIRATTSTSAAGIDITQYFNINPGNNIHTKGWWPAPGRPLHQNRAGEGLQK